MANDNVGNSQSKGKLSETDPSRLVAGHDAIPSFDFGDSASSNNQSEMEDSIFSNRYVSGKITDDQVINSKRKPRSDISQTNDDVGKIEAEKYGIDKPRRVILRGKIIE